MSRFNPHHENTDATLAAAAAWRDRCWVDDGSVFTSGPAWTEGVLAELDERFNGRPDGGSDSFQDKLQRQLSKGAPEACQLAAEMLWIMNLFPSNIGPDRKRETILDAWSWSGAQLPAEHPLLDRELLRGLGSAGPGFLAHRPRELRFLINATRALKRLSREEREALLSDGWTFAQWLDGVPDEGYRQLKHILPFLLFPDDFERIASPGDIRHILERLGGIDRRQLRNMPKVEQDRVILQLRRRLETEVGRPIDFYEPAYQQIWKPAGNAPELPASTGAELRGESESAGSTPAHLNQILYGPPGTGKTFRTVDRALQILDPDFLTENEGDREALKSRFDDLVEAGRIRFVTFHQSFSYEDFVEGLRAEARPDGSIHYYVADGLLKAFCTPYAALSRRLTAGTRLASGYIVMRSTEEILWLQKPNGSSLPMPWEIIDELAGLVDAGRITVDDVRQSKVFEKVPDSRLEKYIINGYNNILGPILEAVRAHNSSHDVSHPRVLIIDEINRGNISKIFGELITLIEPSKRAGADEALTVVLPYSKQPFSVPANLHIIGTMNTADRSLASIDLALRRRFIFEEIEPDPRTLEGIEIAGVDVEALLETMNARIEALLDREHRLGHAYFIGLEASDDIVPLRNLFAAQILPLLQEYFFDDWNRIRLILNDHRKADPQDRFVVERQNDGEALFGPGDLEVPIAKAWQINPGALERPSAYQSIIG
ncbi:MAG: AAA family ATPase [Pseudomonadota bacterium]|nr:AAA family ATPase [Pseudomonadota bacterium]